MLIFKEVPVASHSVFQNVPVNLRSLSDTKDLGKPCNLTISRIKTFATAGAVVSAFRGQKCAILLNLHTTVNMLQLPSEVKGKSVMKSRLKSIQGP